MSECINKESLIASIQEAQTRIGELREVIEKNRNLMVENFCPVKVGDVLPAAGYAHRGKPSKVRRVVFKDDLDWSGRNSYAWRVYAVVLKKDGTESANITDWLIKYTPES